jgi:hypothetical protein
MSDRLVTWARTAVWALPVYGALLAAGTLMQQPDYRTGFGAYAAYVATSTFLASHVIAPRWVGTVFATSITVFAVGVSSRSRSSNRSLGSPWPWLASASRGRLEPPIVQQT